MRSPGFYGGTGSLIRLWNTAVAAGQAVEIGNGTQAVAIWAEAPAAARTSVVSRVGRRHRRDRIRKDHQWQ